MTSLMFPQQCGSQRTAHWSLCAPSTLDPVDWTGSSRLAASTFTSQSLRSLLISLDASWSLCLRLEGGGGTFFQNGVHLCSVWQPRTLNCSQEALSVWDSFAAPAAGRPCDPLLTLCSPPLTFLLLPNCGNISLLMKSVSCWASASPSTSLEHPRERGTTGCREDVVGGVLPIPQPSFSS